MGALRSLGLALALQFATPAHADAVERWRSYIDKASIRSGIPAAWIERVMRAESAGHTTLNGRPIVSRAGAMGLMQLMPGTWLEMRAALGLGADPHDPHDNIVAGAAYLRLMYDRFGYPGLFAAYNAGPARYAAFVTKRRALPQETRLYLASVAGEQTPQRGLPQAVPTYAIFFALRSVPSFTTNNRTGAASLFVPLGMAAATSTESPP